MAGSRRGALQPAGECSSSCCCARGRKAQRQGPAKLHGSCLLHLSNVNNGQLSHHAQAHKPTLISRMPWPKASSRYALHSGCWGVQYGTCIAAAHEPFVTHLWQSTPLIEYRERLVGIQVCAGRRLHQRRLNTPASWWRRRSGGQRPHRCPQASGSRRCRPWCRRWRCRPRSCGTAASGGLHSRVDTVHSQSACAGRSHTAMASCKHNCTATTISSIKSHDGHTPSLSCRHLRPSGRLGRSRSRQRCSCSPAAR